MKKLALTFALLSAAPLRAQDDLPPVTREFRAVWVATVANIDWPSKPGLSIWEQQGELIAIMNRAVALHMNAIVLQVRPAADALYDSQLEPWSEFLTGQMGRPPEPAYDPLTFAVAEAHKRGLELHAWFNPYRAHHPQGKSPISSNHVSVTNPGMVRQYGHYQWFDPGDSAASRHSIAVFVDVVKRYDVDGIHIDDYFYPYKERDSAGAVLDFPDSITWKRYVNGGGTLSRDDWRRSNVDNFVRNLYVAIKKTKPWVKFGISPFGVWRAGVPENTKGFDAYSELYADSKKWLNEGWVDYFTPQLYWQISNPNVPYPVLLRWWVSENTKGRNIWPGNFTSRVGESGNNPWKTQEIIDQIATTRLTEGASGNVHFSARVFMQDRDSIVEKLLAGPYASPALVPASPWLDSIPPRAPAAYIHRDPVTKAFVLDMIPRGAEKTWLWVLRYRIGQEWTTQIFPGEQATHMFDGGKPDEAFLSSVDRTGNESTPTAAAEPPPKPAPAKRAPAKKPKKR
jgi:uncharacterized lipoprotein YddW (UPF0748 family)